MPRKHSLFINGRSIEVPFTADEEIARDTEEAAARAEQPIIAARRQRREELEELARAGTIIFSQLVELKQLELDGA